MSEISTFQQKDLQPDKVDGNESEVKFKGNLSIFDTKQICQEINIPTTQHLNTLEEYQQQ